jgi:hypothetical protein
MARHGLFKEIDIELDRNKADGASKHGVAVNVTVVERGLVGGQVRMDTTGGEARGLAELRLIQPTGHGETVHLAFCPPSHLRSGSLARPVAQSLSLSCMRAIISRTQHAHHHNHHHHHHAQFDVCVCVCVCGCASR